MPLAARSAARSAATPAATSADARAARTLADPRWVAVRGRDRSADGQFFYAVRTTGVYCRPSCASRPARPENVAFFDTAAAAEAAGYRACKRCRPDTTSADAAPAALIARLCRSIEQAEVAPTLQQLAQQANLSPFHLHRLFKAATGLTPKQYGDAQRSRRVHSRLQRTARVTDAIYDAGFNSSGRFYEQSAALLGMTPTRYRAGGAHTEIRFALGQCSLGAIMVAATDRGVCAIALGDDPEALLRELQDRFPRAHLIGGDAQFERQVAQVVGLIEAPRRGLDLPLDVRGTAFQQRVWRALQSVPAGRTVSYAEIAQAIGAPRAVRAVGRAVGANPLAVAIPCHRVIRTDGALSGYRWGVERKRALLAREAAAP